MDKKPGLAILIGHALAQKGKAEHDPMPEEESSDDGSDGGDTKEHLEEIAKDFIDAVESKDVAKVAELFQELFECGLDK